MSADCWGVGVGVGVGNGIRVAMIVVGGILWYLGKNSEAKEAPPA